jgi:hypothetical protein
MHRRIKVVLTLYRDKLEFEYLASIAGLSPCVNKMEDSVVRPDALSQLFVHPNAIWRTRTSFGLLRGTIEETILGRGTRRGMFGLIDKLRIRCT